MTDLAQFSAAGIRSAYSDLDGCADWQQRWTSMRDQHEEILARAQLAVSRAADDEEAAALYNRLVGEIQPAIDMCEMEMAKRLINEPPDGLDWNRILPRLAREVLAFNDEAVQAEARLGQLATVHQMAIANLRGSFEGRLLGLNELRPLQTHTERSIREAAFWASANAILTDRLNLQAIFRRIHELRRDQAAAIRVADPIEYAHLALGRSPGQIASFEAVLHSVVKHAVPAVRQRWEVHARRLGIDAIMPWDAHADLVTDSLTAIGSNEILSSLDALGFGHGHIIDSTRRLGLLDIEDRPGKPRGALTIFLPVTKASAIVLQPTVEQIDSIVFVHECTHALHNHLSAAQSHHWTRTAQTAVAEAFAVGMELIFGQSIERPAGLRRLQLDGFLRNLLHATELSLWELDFYRSSDGDPSAALLAVDEIAGPGAQGLAGIEGDVAPRAEILIGTFVADPATSQHDIVCAMLTAAAIWRNWRKDPDSTREGIPRLMRQGGVIELSDIWASLDAGDVLGDEGIALCIWDMLTEIGRLESQEK